MPVPIWGTQLNSVSGRCEPHAMLHIYKGRRQWEFAGEDCRKLVRMGSDHDHGVSPFWGPGKSLRTLRCRDYLVRLRLQGTGGLGQFSRLAINAIRRTIVRHAKRGRWPQSTIHHPRPSPFWAASIAICGSGGDLGNPGGSGVLVFWPSGGPTAHVCVFITQMSNYLTKDFVQGIVAVVVAFNKLFTVLQLCKIVAQWFRNYYTIQV